MTRVKTGIKGFDELIQGGFPKGNSILYTGSPGTGKTIFGLQYLYNGAQMFKERGLYVSFEQPVKDIENQAKQFGWDLKKFEKSGLLRILSIPAREIKKDTAQEVIRLCEKEKIDRMVIDSLSTLSINAPIYSVTTDLAIADVVENSTFFSPPVIGDLVVKRFIYGFIDDLRKLPNTTTVLISETSKESAYLSRDTISEFLCDGVIVVNFESMGGEYSRSLLVRKMRQTKNDEDIHPLEVGQKGLVVHKIE